MYLPGIIQQRNVSNVPWWLVELGFVVTAHSGQSKGIAGEASGLSCQDRLILSSVPSLNPADHDTRLAIVVDMGIAVQSYFLPDSPCCLKWTPVGPFPLESGRWKGFPWRWCKERSNFSPTHGISNLHRLLIYHLNHHLTGFFYDSVASCYST